MIRRIARLATLFLSFWAVVATADIVHFVNGDRLTGALVEAAPGVVAIDVPHIGIVTAPRGRVARIEAVADAPAEEDAEARTGPGSSGVGWEARADLGMVVATGNTQTRDLNFVAGVKRVGARFDNVLGLSMHRAQATPQFGEASVATKDQVDVDYDLRWKYGDSWYAVANFEYFHDPIKNVDRRATAGAGFGHTVWDSARGALTTDAGISQVFDKVDLGAGGAGVATSGAGDASGSNPALRWGLQYRHWLVVERLELFHNNQLLRILDDDRGSVWDSDTGVRFHVNSRWLAALRMDVQHESAPAPGQKKTDSSYALAVGFKL